MPWSSKSARRHTRKAKTGKQKRQWSHIANSMLKSGKSEGASIRAANAAMKKSKKRHGKKRY